MSELERKYCGNCGAEMDVADVYCGNCGTVVGTPLAASAKVASEVAEVTGVALTEVAETPMDGGRASTGRRMRWLPGGLAVLLGSGAAWWYFNQEGGPQATPEAGDDLAGMQPMMSAISGEDGISQNFDAWSKSSALERMEVKPSEEKPAAARVELEPAQFGRWVMEASSVRRPQLGITYGPENVTGFATGDSPRETAWIEGVSGDGIGEWVQFIFGGKDDALTMSTITIANGYGKSPEIFQKNNRVRELGVSHAGGKEVVVLEDTEFPQKVRLKSPVVTSWIRFTIGGVYQGSQFDETAISDIIFDIENFNYYPPLEGQELKSPDGQLAVWVIAVQKGENLAESLVQVWDPRVPAGEMPRAVGAFDHTSESGSSGRCVSNAGWTPDSRFFAYTTYSSGGHSPWHATGYFFDRKSGRVHCLDDFGLVVVGEGLSVDVPDIIVVTAQREPGDLDGGSARVRLSTLVEKK